MKTHPYVPEHRYSIDEFVGHFDHFIRSPERITRDALMRYFLTYYPNRSEGLYKMNRFGMALAYMMRHLKDFEQFVVIGEERQGLVSEPLIVALARYFGPIPEEYLNDEPEPELILKLAREMLSP